MELNLVLGLVVTGPSQLLPECLVNIVLFLAQVRKKSKLRKPIRSTPKCVVQKDDLLAEYGNSLPV